MSEAVPYVHSSVSAIESTMRSGSTAERNAAATSTAIVATVAATVSGYARRIAATAS